MKSAIALIPLLLLTTAFLPNTARAQELGNPAVTVTIDFYVDSQGNLNGYDPYTGQSATELLSKYGITWIGKVFSGPYAPSDITNADF